MAVREYQCLDELQTITQVSWRIKVTIIRRWNDYPTDRPRDRGFNMIFLDEKNNSMHVWIPFALVHRFADQLFEGGLYEIQDFYVRSFNGKYKCLNQNKHIIMSHATNIRALYVPNFYDPVPFFEFTDLANLTEDNFQDSHCIDVVGIIRLRKRIKYITNRNNQQYTYLDFAISDARTEVKVRFWEECGLSCNIALNNAAMQPIQPIAITISSCRMIRDTNTDKIMLYDAPSTQFYINHNSVEVQNLRNRFWAVGQP